MITLKPKVMKIRNENGGFDNFSAVIEKEVVKESTDSNNTTIVTNESIDDYVIAESERVAEAVQSRQGEYTLSIMACSDLHFSYELSNTKQQQASLMHMGQAMGLIRKSVNIDLGVMLGDIHWDHGESVDNALKGARYVNSCLYDGFSDIPIMRARGNHECLYHNDTGLTDKQIFANIGIFNKGTVYGDNRIGGYCYRDFEDIGIRVICINTSESNDGSFSVSAEQNEWLASVLNTEELMCILLSHHPLDWGGSNSNVMQTVKQATSVICNIHGHVHGNLVDSLVGTNSEVLGCPIPRIATPNACFGRENEYGENGAPENSEGIEFGETVTYKKTANTCNDTAFVVYTLNFDEENHKIYADNYGAGYGRVIPLTDETIPTYTITRNLTNVSCLNSIITSLQEGASFGDVVTADSGFKVGTVTITMGGVDITDECYSNGKIAIPAITGNVVITVNGEEGTDEPVMPGEPTVNYTNLVPTSIDTDGSIFNGVGYKTGYRLSSSGEETELNNAICSGYTPYNSETVRAWGSDASTPGTTGNSISLYDESFNFIYTLPGHAEGMLYEALNGKYLMTIIPTNFTEAIQEYLSQAKYIRCGFGYCLEPSKFVVTLDEVIE